MPWKKAIFFRNLDHHNQKFMSTHFREFQTGGEQCMATPLLLSCTPGFSDGSTDLNRKVSHFVFLFLFFKYLSFFTFAWMSIVFKGQRLILSQRIPTRKTRCLSNSSIFCHLRTHLLFWLEFWCNLQILGLVTRKSLFNLVKN